MFVGKERREFSGAKVLRNIQLDPVAPPPPALFFFSLKEFQQYGALPPYSSKHSEAALSPLFAL